MTEIVIRPAASGDAADVTRIVTDAYAPLAARMDRLPGPMRDDYPARIADGVVWVLCDGTETLGILVLVDQNGALLLENVAVAPSVHGRGLGRRLIDFAETEARRRGHDTVRLYTHLSMVENQRMYIHLGYREIGRNTEHGFDRVHYEKRL